MFGYKTKLALKELQIQNTTLNGTLARQSKEIQNLHYNILTISKSTELDNELKYGWNRFTNYKNAIQEIHDMYDCKLSWGGSVGPMIDLRAGFVGGSGIEIDMDDPEAEREKAFVEEFLKYNGFLSGDFLAMLRDFEKEGKVLLRLKVDDKHEWQWMEGETERKETGMIRIDYLSAKGYQYKVFADPENSAIADYVEWGGKKQLTKENFVYRRFRGSPNDIDTAIPIWWRIIEHIVGLEKAYADMRMNNHLFAAPKPIIECETDEQAKKIDAALNPTGGGHNLKTRNILILGGGTFKYAVPAEKTDLQTEIEQHRYAISFNTGIPVQFLGDPAAVRNKNVSENLMEGINHHTETDRKIIEDLLNEAIEKAIDLKNGVLTPLKKKKIAVHIGEISDADWNRLVAFYLPAKEKEMISHRTFLEKIPDIDPEQELERLEEEEKEKEEKKEEERQTYFDKIMDPERADHIEENNFNKEASNGIQQKPRYQPGGNNRNGSNKAAIRQTSKGT